MKMDLCIIMSWRAEYFRGYLDENRKSCYNTKGNRNTKIRKKSIWEYVEKWEVLPCDME